MSPWKGTIKKASVDSRTRPTRRRIKRPLLQGHLHTTRAWHVDGLPHPIRATLYLPPDYHQGQEHYPVAFMFDGQNLFGDEGSFSGGWHLHTALNARATRGKLVPVVVGIHHGGSSRATELSPWPIDAHHEGRLDTLLDWVVGPLYGMVKEDVRILAGPEHTMVGGSSLGGLAALYAFFRHNDRLGRALVMSPALWPKDGEIFHYVARARAAGDPRIYLDCGGREAHGHALEHAQWMADLLERKGFVRDYHFIWRPDKRGAHNERNWRRRLPKALKFLYG